MHGRVHLPPEEGLQISLFSLSSVFLVKITKNSCSPCFGGVHMLEHQSCKFMHTFLCSCCILFFHSYGGVGFCLVVFKGANVVQKARMQTYKTPSRLHPAYPSTPSLTLQDSILDTPRPYLGYMKPSFQKHQASILQAPTPHSVNSKTPSWILQSQGF